MRPVLVLIAESEEPTVSNAISTASTSQAAPTANSLDGGMQYFLLKRLHSLTSLVFGGYLVVHLTINATLIEGTRHAGAISIFTQQVQKIHSLPFLWAIEWAFIFLPIIFHSIYGIWIALSGQPNAVNYPFARNVFYVLQRVSTIIIVVFMMVHVLGFKGIFGDRLAFDPSVQGTVLSVKGHIMAHWSLAYVLYPVGVLASCFHLANGFWGAAVTWGLAISSAAQRRWGMLCVGVFCFTLICGTLALLAIWRM
jgi:succinate dehydrogenase / fumarate reductase, cytochrome b subunit